MSTKPTTETTESAATRHKFSRQIDEAFEEASKLAGSSLTPTEFYEQFLNRTLSAIEAPAGVVWLRTPQGFLQIACQINLEKINLDAKRGGRQCHNEILRQVFQAAPPRPVLVEPQGRLQGITAEPGAVPAANLTDHYAMFAPIVQADKSPLGLLEVFHDPSLDPRLYQTFLQYAVQMAGYASQYHTFTNARQSAGLEKVFAQVEQFAKMVHSSLNPTEVAYHVANEGRRIVECDRLCVAVRHSKKCTVEAVSGADVVEKASTHVRRMRELFDAVIKFGDKLVYNGNKDEGLPPDLSNALDEYLAESQPKLLVVMPIRDEREKDNNRPARSALLMEAFNPPEQVEPLIQRLDVVSKHAATALYNSAEMQRIPFRFLWRPVGLLQEALGGKHRFYYILGAIGIMLLTAAMVLVPYPMKLDAKGEYLPQQVQMIYSTHDGEVRDILVKPGQRIKEKAGIVSMFSQELQKRYMEVELEAEKAKDQVSQLTDTLGRSMPLEREQQYNGELSKQKKLMESRSRQLTNMREMYGLIPNQPGRFIVRAPSFDPSIPRKGDEWIVLSDDRRNELTRRAVRQNEALVRLGVVDGPWRVELKVPQRNIGHVAYALATAGMHKVDKENEPYIEVDVLLASMPDTSFPGRMYKKDMGLEAVPDKGDHNQTEPVVLAYVRVNLDDFPKDRHIPEALNLAGQEVFVKLRCGEYPLGYSLFHGVWEWFYEKVVFFF